MRPARPMDREWPLLGRLCATVDSAIGIGEAYHKSIHGAAFITIRRPLCSLRIRTMLKHLIAIVLGLVPVVPAVAADDILIERL